MILNAMKERVPIGVVQFVQLVNLALKNCNLKTIAKEGGIGVIRGAMTCIEQRQTFGMLKTFAFIGS